MMVHRSYLSSVSRIHATSHGLHWVGTEVYTYSPSVGSSLPLADATPFSKENPSVWLQLASLS